jgi:hypothetical protein
MKFWTQQLKSALEIIMENGIYFPNFSEDEYLKNVNAIETSYSHLLNEYNNKAGKKYKGLIFGFIDSDPANPVSNLKELLSKYYSSNRLILFDPSIYVLLELDIPDDIYVMPMIPVDIEKFEDLIVENTKKELKEEPNSNSLMGILPERSNILYTKYAEKALLKPCILDGEYDFIRAYAPLIKNGWIKSISNFDNKE